MIVLKAMDLHRTQEAVQRHGCEALCKLIDADPGSEGEISLDRWPIKVELHDMARKVIGYAFDTLIRSRDDWCMKRLIVGMGICFVSVRPVPLTSLPFSKLEGDETSDDTMPVARSLMDAGTVFREIRRDYNTHSVSSASSVADPTNVRIESNLGWLSQYDQHGEPWIEPLRLDSRDVEQVQDLEELEAPGLEGLEPEPEPEPVDGTLEQSHC